MQTKTIAELAAALGEKAHTASEQDKVLIQEAIAKLWSNSKEIDKLQSELKTEKEDRAKDKIDYEEQRKSEWINHYKKTMIDASATIFDELGPDLKFISVTNVIDRALSKQNLEFAFDEKGEMQLLTKDGTKHFGANHTVITPKDFVDSVLAQNKVLKSTVTQLPEKIEEHIVTIPANELPDIAPGEGSAFIKTNDQAVANFNKSTRKGFNQNQ